MSAKLIGLRVAQQLVIEPRAVEHGFANHERDGEGEQLCAFDADGVGLGGKCRKSRLFDHRVQIIVEEARWGVMNDE